VPAVLEILPFLTGLRRNYVQCLLDYNIPLHLSTTVNNIYGENRVEAIETVKVDDKLQPVEGTEQVVECDTLILSVGLLPENELSRKAGVELDSRSNGPVVDSHMMTSVPGIFAAGNVTAIYDLVDYVSKSGEIAGRSAAQFARAGTHDSQSGITLKPGTNVGVAIPQKLRFDDDRSGEMFIMLRPNALLERAVKVELKHGDEVVGSFREQYARPAEMMIYRLKERELARLRELKTGELTAAIS